MDDLESYLRAKGLNPRRAGRDNVCVPCFVHGEDQGTKRGRLYVNVGSDPETVGLWTCFVCGAKGNLLTLLRHFGDEPERESNERSHEKHLVLQDAAAYYKERLEPEHFKWLRQERGLTAQTIDRHDIGWADGHLHEHLLARGHEWRDMASTGLVGSSHKQDDPEEFVLGKSNVYDFLKDCITIVYHVAGSVVQIRGKKINGKYLTPPGQKARLFNSDAVWNTDEAFLTEGEFDAMVLEQMGYRTMGVPGAKTWQDNWDGYFDHVKRIYTVFDNDRAGFEGAEIVKDRLGRKVRVVSMPENGLPPGENDVSLYFGKEQHTKEEFESLIRKVRVGILVSVAEARAEWESVQGLDGYKLGFEELDALIRPGLLPGQVTIPLARTNVGKSLWLLNTMQRASMVQPESGALFISLEQTRGDWFERARRIYNFYNLNADPDKINDLTEDYWTPRLMMVDANRVTGEELYAAIEDYRGEMGQLPAVVHIDYLGYWANTFKGDRYERLSDAVMAIKGISKDVRIPIVAPHQLNRGGDMGSEPSLDEARDSGVIEETADFAFGVWNPDTKSGFNVEDRTGNVNIKVLKSRHGGKGHVVRLQFGYSTLVMVPMSESSSRLAKDEIEYDNRGEDWQTSILRHKTGVKHGPVGPVSRVETTPVPATNPETESLQMEIGDDDEYCPE